MNFTAARAAVCSACPRLGLGHSGGCDWIGAIRSRLAVRGSIEHEQVGAVAHPIDGGGAQELVVGEDFVPLVEVKV